MCGEKHLPTLAAVEAAPNRYLKLPSHEDFDDWALMRDYVAGIDDADPRARLERAIHGPGAFGRFHEVLDEAGRRGDWEDFRGQRHTEYLREWCKEHDVILKE